MRSCTFDVSCVIIIKYIAKDHLYFNFIPKQNMGKLLHLTKFKTYRRTVFLHSLLKTTNANENLWVLKFLYFSVLISTIHNVTTVNITSTSITISWTTSTSNDSTNKIAGIVVIYSTEHAENWTKILVNASKKSVNIKGLDKFTWYCIKVMTYTRKQRGNFSRCVFVSTDEDGKIYFVFVPF